MGDAGAVQRALNDAVSKVIAEQEGGFVTKWVALIESAGPDGERGLWTCTSDDIRKWDTIGMLRYAEHLELSAPEEPE